MKVFWTFGGRLCFIFVQRGEENVGTEVEMKVKDMQKKKKRCQSGLEQPILALT